MTHDPLERQAVETAVIVDQAIDYMTEQAPKLREDARGLHR
jgi:hypothetical protein